MFFSWSFSLCFLAQEISIILYSSLMILPSVLSSFLLRYFKKFQVQFLLLKLHLISIFFLILKVWFWNWSHNSSLKHVNPGYAEIFVSWFCYLCHLGWHLLMSFFSELESFLVLVMTNEFLGKHHFMRLSLMSAALLCPVLPNRGSSLLASSAGAHSHYSN